jgi:hypothetical protein
MIKFNFGRKGQIFSIDALFALLPIMMIMGASIQYLYLAEEESMSLAMNSRAEVTAQVMSEYVIATQRVSDEGYIKEEGCEDFMDALDEFTEKMPSNYIYYVRATSYTSPDIGKQLCRGDKLWS